MEAKRFFKQRGILSKSRAELAALKTTGKLIPGQQYLINDLAEKILITASSSSSLSLEGQLLALNADYQSVGDYSGVEAVTGLAPGLSLGIFQSTQGSFSYNNLTGTFAIGETITGQTSGAIGIIVDDTGAVLTLKQIYGTFAGSEQITGNQSYAIATKNGDITYTFYVDQGDLVIWNGSHWQKLTGDVTSTEPDVDPVNYVQLLRTDPGQGYIPETDEIDYDSTDPDTARWVIISRRDKRDNSVYTSLLMITFLNYNPIDKKQWGRLASEGNSVNYAVFNDQNALFPQRGNSLNDFVAVPLSIVTVSQSARVIDSDFSGNSIVTLTGNDSLSKCIVRNVRVTTDGHLAAINCTFMHIAELAVTGEWLLNNTRLNTVAGASILLTNNQNSALCQLSNVVAENCSTINITAYLGGCNYNGCRFYRAAIIATNEDPLDLQNNDISNAEIVLEGDGSLKGCVVRGINITTNVQYENKRVEPGFSNFSASVDITGLTVVTLTDKQFAGEIVLTSANNDETLMAITGLTSNHPVKFYPQNNVLFTSSGAMKLAGGVDAALVGTAGDFIELTNRGVGVDNIFQTGGETY